MILDINIKNNKQTVELISENSVHEIAFIYMDTYDNRDNYMSTEDGKHSFKFPYSTLSPVVTGMYTTYTINASMLNLDRIVGLYILTIVYDDDTIEQKIVYDTNELYCIRMKYMEKVCNTCTDIANNRMLINLMFNEMLLRNSIALNLIDDSLKYYTDIYRPVCKNGIVSNKCSSGLCNI